VGDVFWRTHPSGRHRREVSPPDLDGDVGVTFDRDEPGSDRVHGDAVGGELAGPASSQADLRILRRGVSRPSGWRTMRYLGVDLDDPAEPGRLHVRKNGSGQQYRTLDEEVELSEVVIPAHLGHLRLRLRTGRVHHQDVNRPQAFADRRHEFGDVLFVGDVGRKEVRDATVLSDRLDDLKSIGLGVQTVDGHG